MIKAPEKYRVTEAVASHYKHLNLKEYVSTQEYGNNGLFFLPRIGKESGLYYFCIISDGKGWEHVSVTITSERRTPSWDEMCYIKNTFWGEDESVVQFHPPKNQYVNNHPYALHLWKPTTFDIPVPFSGLVGIPKKIT